MEPTPTTKKKQRRGGRRVAHVMPERNQPGTMQDRVAARVSGVEIPVLPWDQNYMTEEEAWRQGLVTVARLAEMSKISKHTWNQWKSRFPDFPNQKAQTRNGRTTSSFLYDAREVRTWYASKMSIGHIRTKPRDKNNDCNEEKLVV